jgi:two-component system sensor histidine kinase RegB
MWVAFGVAASFIVYFVQRVTRALAERERELDDARAATARAERLASLATLAAGAAHELSTPLSTIAVVAKELERELERLRAAESALGDARLIRDQVERCRDILVQMAADAGESTGEDFAPITVARLVDSSIEGLAERERIALSVAASEDPVVVPVRSVAQAVRAVTKNALQASPRHAPIALAAELSHDVCRIEVRDSGSGMSPEVLARAGEPFFTTKGTGQGMGLGLFLARAVLERLGGRLELRSTPGAGTTVVLLLPARPSFPLRGHLGAARAEA